MAGWVKLHRKLRYSEVWHSEEPFTRGQAWVDLLMAANYKPRTIFVRGVPVRLERGQVGESTVTLAGKWNRSRGWVTRFLLWLESEQQIVQQKNNVTSIISICNYDEYQQVGTADDTASDTADGQQIEQQTVQQTDTTKKEEKVKKEENGKKQAAFIPPTLEEVQEYVRQKKYRFDPETFIAHHGARGWVLGRGVPMKCWKLACTTFEKNHDKFGGNGKQTADDPRGNQATLQRFLDKLECEDAQ